MIYFFQRADGDIKIGVTHDYHRRLQNLQTEHGKLTLLGLLDGGREAEEKLHYEFRAFRSHREWFSPDRSLLDFIAKNTHLNIPVRRRYSIRERGMRIISTDAPMKTGQLAALLGVSVGTVRNWLDHPLLQPYYSPGSLTGVQRDLTQSDVAALNTVHHLRSSGVTDWTEIAAYLKTGQRHTELPAETALSPDTRSIPLPQAEQSARAAATLAERDAALARVAELEAELERLRHERDTMRTELLREINDTSQRFLREIADLNREIGRLEGRLDKPSS